MPIAIQTGNSVDTNLFHLINASNSIEGTANALHTGQVTFGTPTPRTPGADPSNTSLVLTPVAGQGFNGNPVTITYTRPRIDKSSASPTLSVDVPTNQESFVSTLLTIVAGNISVMSDQIELDASTPLSSVQNDGVPVNLTFNAIAGSLLYTGSVVIAVSWPVEQQDLNSVLTVKQMDGFTEAGA